MKRLSIRCQLYEGTYITLDDAIDRLRDAYKEYKTASKNAEAWRDDHNERLIEDLATENKTTKETIRRRMKRERRQRQQGAIARSIRKKNIKNPVTKVIATYDFGQPVTCTTQDTIVQACGNSNLRRQTQSEDTPFLNSPLLEEIGYLAELPAADEILEGTYRPPARTDRYAMELI